MAELLRLNSLSQDWHWSRCAVIARKWAYLIPVRAFCELHGIRAQMGNEEIPGFWRLRETRAFVDWLRDRENGVVDRKALRGWVNACAPNAWNGLLRQAIDEHELETGGVEAPVSRVLPTSGRNPVPVSKRSGSRGLEPRGIGSQVSRPDEMRCQGSDRAGVGHSSLNANHYGYRRTRGYRCPRHPPHRLFATKVTGHLQRKQQAICNDSGRVFARATSWTGSGSGSRFPDGRPVSAISSWL